MKTKTYEQAQKLLKRRSDLLEEEDSLAGVLRSELFWLSTGTGYKVHTHIIDPSGDLAATVIDIISSRLERELAAAETEFAELRD